MNAVPTLDFSQHEVSQHQPPPPSYHNDTADALANLATATSADRATVATLTDTVAKLSAELADAQGKLVQALLENGKLLKQLASRTTRGMTGSGFTTSGGADAPKVHYCHTCGYLSNHPSFRCEKPGPNHQRMATKRDTMGGSVVNKPAGW